MPETTYLQLHICVSVKSAVDAPSFFASRGELIFHLCMTRFRVCERRYRPPLAGRVGTKAQTHASRAVLHAQNPRPITQPHTLHVSGYLVWSADSFRRAQKKIYAA
jgi:hypothetical protein